MRKFRVIFRNVVGFVKYKCLTMAHRFSVPKDRQKEKYVWCPYCGEREKK